MFDIINSFQLKRAISPQVFDNNVAVVSQIIDVRGYKSAGFVIATGAIPDADATFVILVEEGDNSALSDAAAVADADLIGQAGNSPPELEADFRFDDDNEVRKIGYIGSKRYIRLTITPSANTSSPSPSNAAYICAMAVLGHPDVQPVVQADA